MTASDMNVKALAFHLYIRVWDMTCSSFISNLAKGALRYAERLAASFLTHLFHILPFSPLWRHS